METPGKPNRHEKLQSIRQEITNVSTNREYMTDTFTKLQY